MLIQNPNVSLKCLDNYGSVCFGSLFAGFVRGCQAIKFRSMLGERNCLACCVHCIWLCIQNIAGYCIWWTLTSGSSSSFSFRRLGGFVGIFVCIVWLSTIAAAANVVIVSKAPLEFQQNHPDLFNTMFTAFHEYFSERMEYFYRVCVIAREGEGENKISATETKQSSMGGKAVAFFTSGMVWVDTPFWGC